ncbi:MAG: insulinase family protein [Firmicutes bacterium]|nr:insulinase family protein [Bacillota bacterium]
MPAPTNWNTIAVGDAGVAWIQVGAGIDRPNNNYPFCQNLRERFYLDTNKYIEYPNGLRLVVMNMPSLRTVASGIWVRAGSICEDEGNNGIAHFIEHMIFKGTDKLTAFEIADNFESMGAAVNAFTGKENTCYFAKSTDEYGKKCFELLSNIFFDSAFDETEMEKERGVVVEEFNMTEDSTEDICFDLLATALYDKHPLGKSILGPIENIKNFNRADIAKFIESFYTAKNIVISIAGNVSLEQADKWVREYFLPRVSPTKTTVYKDTAHSSCTTHLERFKEQFEQCNFALGYPTVPFYHKDYNTQSVVNMILGGGMSSRLFQHIREQKGLAYSVYSGQTSYAANGSLNIICNTNPANYIAAKNAAQEVVNDLIKGGITDNEWNRAKTQIKSAFLFGQESCQSMMISAGKLMLAADKVFDVDQKIAEIQNVTKKDGNAFVKKYMSGDCLCSAYVGKEVKN